MAKKPDPFRQPDPFALKGGFKPPVGWVYEWRRNNPLQLAGWARVTSKDYKGPKSVDGLILMKKRRTLLPRVEPWLAPVTLSDILSEIRQLKAILKNHSYEMYTQGFLMGRDVAGPPDRARTPARKRRKHG